MVRALLLGVVPLAFLLGVTLGGADFGQYWDDEAMATKVRRALAPPLTLLPFAYDYPGVPFWIALAAVSPEAAGDRGVRHAVPDTSALVSFTRTDAYRRRSRAVFAALSSLAAVATAGLSIAAGAVSWEALLAAALFAVSWEVNYHFRWIAPDGVMTALVAGAVVAAAASLRPSADRARLLGLAAVAAGLATASKYSAWPALVPVALAAWITREGEAPVRRSGAALKTILVAVLTFLVFSPGTVLQPVLAFGQIRAQVAHYGAGHGVYTVSRGVDHLRRMLLYDAIVLPSPYAAIAIGLTATAIAGAWALCRRSPKLALVVLGFPAGYTIYLALQRVMIARNLIVLAPFGAILAARGFRVAWEAAGRTRWPAVRAAVPAVAAAVVAVHAVFDVSAVASIRGRSVARTANEFSEWLVRQPAGSVQLSDRLQRALDDPAGPPAADADIAMFALDAGHEGIRPNEPRVFAHVFGPREVNLNYYTDWIGDEHIVVLSRRQALRFGVVAR